MRRAFAILLILLWTQVPVWALSSTDDPEPPPESGFPSILEYLPAPVEVSRVGSIGEALTHDNGETVELNDKVVTGRFTEGGVTFVYIEDDDRGAGIRVDVADTSPVVLGDRVNVEGTLGVTGGERRLYNTTVEITQHQCAVPGPLAMDNPTVGGKALNEHTPGITGATGPYNKGLLIMTWGRVTSTSDGAFCIDDGSALADGPGTNLGIRVIASGPTLMTNQYVVVTGVSSSFESGGKTYRQIRVRGAADVAVITTGTAVSSPTGLLSSPAQGNWWALVGLPNVPIDPNPESVFLTTKDYMPSDALIENLSWFDSVSDQDWYEYVYYDGYKLVLSPTQQDPGHTERQGYPFGVVYSARGYWVRLSETDGSISYQGVGAPVQSTDRYISLPCHSYTLIGNPFDHSVFYQSVLVSDGKTVLSLMDAWRNNWIYPYGFWWNCANQSQYMVEGDLEWADLETGICMRPWHGFWVCSNKDALALIIVKAQYETMSVTANPPYIAPAGTYEITAKARLRSGYPLENAVIEFTTTAGTLSATTPSSGRTDQNGEVKVTLSNVPAGQSPVVTATSDYACPGPITASCAVPLGDCPTFMHDPQHTGLNPVVDPVVTETFNNGAGPNWAAAVPTSQVSDLYTLPLHDSSPVVSGGTVVVGAWTAADTGDVRAFNATTGNPLWIADANGEMGGVAATACIAGGRVYAGSADGYMYCLDLGDGHQIWRAAAFEPGDSAQIFSSPVTHQGVVYAMNTHGLVYAFDSQSGQRISGWPVLLQACDYRCASSPAIATVGGVDYLLVGTGPFGGMEWGGGLHRVDLSTREVLALQMAAGVESSPSVSADGYAYFGSSTYWPWQNLHKVSISPSFAIVAEAYLDAEVRATPALGYGYAYVGTDTGYRFHQRSADTLMLVSYFEAQGMYNYYFLSSAALTNTGSSVGIAYVGNDDGYLYARRGSEVALPANSGSEYATGGMIRSTPALAYMAEANGSLQRWVYVTTRAEGGKVLAFKTVVL